MRRKPLFWQLYPSFLWIMFLAITVIMACAFLAFRHQFYSQTTKQLESSALLLVPKVRELVENKRLDELDQLVKHMGGEANVRITVVLTEGKVVADSGKDIVAMDGHGSRPEIMAALEGGKGTDRRYSRTIEKDMIYVAVPVRSGGKIQAIVRTALPVDAIRQALWTIYAEVVVIAVLLVVIVAVVSWIYTRKISEPLESMRLQAESISKGEHLGVAHTSLSVASEIEGLGQAINEMAFQLNSRMQTILQQKNEQEAVLASMAEGVIAIDPGFHILNLNNAAAGMLAIKRKQALNKSVEEVIRIPELQRFIRRVREGDREVVEEVKFGDTDRFWQLHGNALRGPDGNELGILLVISDVSRMRELEGHRRDFVANVSHELRTPLTSIKGFLETLKDGAIEDKEQALRFVDIALKHADRLNAIIEDLLKLSRIEKEHETNEIQLTHGSVRKVLDDAIQLCEMKWKQKTLKVELDCPPKLEALINPPLLEQAVVNLLDNAIKYSDEGAAIEIKGQRRGSDVVILVRDHGPGIAPEHQSRIFERFYRVDKARSRAMGGTGLGLAIVKHVAIAHRGTAEVTSEVGKGSEFSIRLKAFA